MRFSAVKPSKTKGGSHDKTQDAEARQERPIQARLICQVQEKGPGIPALFYVKWVTALVLKTWQPEQAGEQRSKERANLSGSENSNNQTGSALSDGVK